MKKKKKKQEPIFSILEEIRIEKKEKFFKQEIIPGEIKVPEETTAFFQPETIAVVSLEPPQAISSPTAVLLPAEQEALSPEVEKAEEITIPSISEPVPVVTPEPSAETLVSSVVSLPDGHEIISPGEKEIQGIVISCEPETPVVLPSPPEPIIPSTATPSMANIL